MLNLTSNIANRLSHSEVLVLACSAGGFKVLFSMLKELPRHLSLVVLVVIHRNAKYETNIEANIAGKCNVPIKVAEEKEHLENGKVYFAPAGYHLLVEPDRTISLDISEPVNFCRPSIDVTMQSVADVYGSKTIGILLSGANHDGASGMLAIKQAGGVCIVQDPVHAEIKTMPESAINAGAAQLIFDDQQLIAFARGLDHHNLKNDQPWKN